MSCSGANLGRSNKKVMKKVFVCKVFPCKLGVMVDIHDYRCIILSAMVIILEASLDRFERVFLCLGGRLSVVYLAFIGIKFSYNCVHIRLNVPCVLYDAEHV